MEKKKGDLMDSWIAFFESHFLGCLRCWYTGKSFDPAALPDVRKHSLTVGDRQDEVCRFLSEINPS